MLKIRACGLVLLASFCGLSALTCAAAETGSPKKIVFIAGKPSHGYGSHEHLAGCRILADTVRKLVPGTVVEVVSNGWPQDASVLDGCDSVVFYADGGGGHPLMGHFDQLKPHMDRGAGLVCIHYAVEIPPGEPGDALKQWLGGYFEINYSVNPHWVANYEKLPEHPITRGVEPFSANDEWYYHMRFVPEMRGVTPILSALPPEDTLRRPDGAHSGNPDVRKAIANGEVQHMAWAYERPQKGRSFGFTGGHFHWNWGRPEIRRLVANAILWTSGAEPPDATQIVRPVSAQDLSEGQDEPKPSSFDAKKVAEEFHLSSIGAPKPATAGGKSRLLASTAVITSQTPGHRAAMEAPIAGVKKLFLVIDDGGDGFSCDWADWLEPTLIGPQGKKSLLDLKPVKTEAQWGEVHMNQNAGGQPLSVAGQPAGPGIGAHANSVIEFDLPAGYEKLTVTGALDSGGTSQQEGRATSVRFSLYADAAPENLSNRSEEGGDQRDAARAVTGLWVADGLEATLSASEPHLKSLTNIDIDARGRVWVCDVMNYRRNSGRRPEGDRILILEDQDQDGVMDVVKTFYQGNDIDSAMGICVLGNQVIVSATPNVWRFVDEDGDDRPDRKEAMFTKTGQPQHDHSVHSFLFGPDGRLYWNFGNTGQAVNDASGNPVSDIHGRVIVDNGKPFFGGMAFRCEMDGSQMEVLGHNFRNNYETTVDSFGRLWQSDNDDDGNRGVRINYVVEQGNYGYRDELTGAGWQAERIGWESEIPLRHWHLNDPGVMPNLVQTGAGSPTGITVNEGSLLPAPFKNEVIHCDAGPNVVRAYPAQATGAGYSGSIADLMVGKQDQWFRPADVCVAPDGSLFVSDWYDPGVGGHRQEDLDRGRLFRVAPKGTPYKIPKFDFSTAEGAATALRNPAASVRYLAWTKLHSLGVAAEPVLTTMWKDNDPRLRARALWLLGRIEGRGQHWVDAALADADPQIRATGLRLARQLKLSPTEMAKRVVRDADPLVRAEALVSLRFDRSAEMPTVWAQLAERYQGEDRWYLEILGLSSDLRANECFEAWRKLVGDKWNHAAGRDIVWRIRADAAAPLLANAIADESVSLAQTDRYFRSLEYHTPAVREAALKTLLQSTASAKDKERSDAIVIRAIERVPGMDWQADENLRKVVMRYADKVRGTRDFLTMVKRLNVENAESALMEIVARGTDATLAVESIELLLSRESGEKLVAGAVQVKEANDMALQTTKFLGILGKPPAMRLLVETMLNGELPFAIRAEAARAASMSNVGQKRLLDLATNQKIPGDLKLLVGGLLASSQDANLREQAGRVLPMPKTVDQAPLPPLDQLAKRAGDVARGAELFRTKSTCANCHVVNGQGKAVGPDLSEIGAKLTREALYVSIVDPSAGISHNFENYQALLDSGQIVSGVMVSQDAESVTLRTPEAVDRRLTRDTIEELKKSEKSLMPENLHHLTDVQGLVDVVEYLVTLKTKK